MPSGVSSGEPLRTVEAEKLPLPLPARSVTVAPPPPKPQLATARSSLPSPLKSPRAKATGSGPTAVVVGPEKRPVPSPKRIPTVPEVGLIGVCHREVVAAVAVEVADHDGGGVAHRRFEYGRSENAPLPLPRRNRDYGPTSPIVTARSSRPSPLKSPTTMPAGFAPPVVNTAGVENPPLPLPRRSRSCPTSRL